MTDVLMAEVCDPLSAGPNVYLGSVDIEVGFASSKPNKMPQEPYDQDVLAAAFIEKFKNQVFSPGQLLLLDHKNIPLTIKIKTVTLRDLGLEKPSEEALTETRPSARGILTKYGMYTSLLSCCRTKRLICYSLPQLLQGCQYTYQA
jgi:vesicle-fusing ATPase